MGNTAGLVCIIGFITLSIQVPVEAESSAGAAQQLEAKDNSEVAGVPRSGLAPEARAAIPVSIRALRDLGVRQFRAGKYSEAVLYCKAALLALENEGVQDFVELVSALNSLGSAQRELGEYTGAIAAHERALGILSQHAPNPALLAFTHYALAAAENAYGAQSFAKEHFEKALDLSRDGRGLGTSEMAKSLLCLARLYMERGEPLVAERLLKQARNVYEGEPGHVGEEWVDYLSSKAALYFYQGRYTEAETFWSRAQRNAEDQFGPYNLSASTMLARRGELRLLLNENEDAIELLTRCVTSREKALGTSHPDVAIVLSQLAVVHGRIGETDKAAALYERALRILRADAASNGFYLALTLSYQSEFLFAQKKWESAAAALQESLSLLQKFLGDSHPVIPQTMLALAKFLKKCNRKSEARVYKAAARSRMAAIPEAQFARRTVDVRSLRSGM